MLPGEPEVDKWIDDMVMNQTPEEWADEALARATVKKTRRPYLRHHIARVIREAQATAVKKANSIMPEGRK